MSAERFTVSDLSVMHEALEMLAEERMLTAQDRRYDGDEYLAAAHEEVAADAARLARNVATAMSMEGYPWPNDGEGAA